MSYTVFLCWRSASETQQTWNKVEQLCHHLHFELKFVKNSFSLLQSSSLSLHQCLLLCQKQMRVLKKIGATEWVSPFVPLCWLLSKSRVRAFSAATTCHNKTGITFGGGGLKKGAEGEGVANENHYALVQNPLISQKMWSWYISQL